MANSTPTPGASLSSPQATHTVHPPSPGRMKRKAMAGDATEQDDDSQPSRAKATKRTKLSHHENDVPAPAKTPVANIARKERTQNAACASGDRTNVDTPNTTAEQSAPPSRIPKRKRAVALEDEELTGDTGTQKSKNHQPAENTPGPRSKKIRTHLRGYGDSHKAIKEETRVAPNGSSGPISLASLATGVATTRATKDAQSFTKPTQPTATVATEDEQEQTFVPLPAPDVSGVDLTEFFTIPLPAKVEPWNFEFPQAYERYADDVDCPINWDKFPDLDRYAYEFQAHWTPNPRTDEQARKLYEEKTGKTFKSCEGFRKRFQKVNRAIFAATGVYFLHKGIGLRDYGVPADSLMAKKMKETYSGKYAHVVYKPSQKSKKEDESKMHLDEASKKQSIDEVKVLKAVDLVLELPSGQVVAHLLSEKVFDSLRIASSTEVFSEEKCFDYFTEDTFNRWHSCVCFGPRRTFPKRVYKLKRFDVTYPIIDRVLTYSGDEYKYADEGMPPVTIQTLLDTYCMSQFMGTTGVSDMILDEIRQVLENETDIDTKYAQGGICEGDCRDVVRLQDLLPQDIKKLWLATKPEDPIRHLILGLLTGSTVDECRRLSATYPLRSARKARNLWSRFIKGQCQKAIASLVTTTSSDEFCTAYHNHGASENCHRTVPTSALSKQMIDATLEEPNIHKLEINGVHGCRVINKTSAGLDLNLLQGQKPQWDWERVESVNSWIVANPNRPQTRERRPVYFEHGHTDAFGRYPSHPGYKNPAWRELVDDNEYAKDEWEKAKRFDIPGEAQRVRDGKGTDDIFFELEDDEWIPPPSFAPEVLRRPDQSYQSYQSYRRWLWVKEGNKAPMKTCYRWRPYNGEQKPREDTFKDAPRRR